MNNRFLSPEQVTTLSNRSDEINRRHCEARYASLGDGIGSALFRACRKTWGTGPATTSARLCSEAADHIMHAWKHRDHIGGLLLQQTHKGFVPLYLHNVGLGPKLAERGSLWIDLKEIEKELSDDTNGTCFSK